MNFDMCELSHTNVRIDFNRFANVDKRILGLINDHFNARLVGSRSLVLEDIATGRSGTFCFTFRQSKPPTSGKYIVETDGKSIQALIVRSDD